MGLIPPPVYKLYFKKKQTVLWAGVPLENLIGNIKLF